MVNLGELSGDALRLVLLSQISQLVNTLNRDECAFFVKYAAKRK